MAYTPRDEPWVDGPAPGNLIDAGDLNRLEGNDADANTRLAAIEGLGELATDADVTAAVAAHTADADPHSGYVLESAAPELIRDTIGAALVQGPNVTITVNDVGDTITVAAANTTDAEVVRDTMAAALVAGANVTITPNDAGDTITVAASTDPEVVRDTIAAALVAGGNITITPNDGADTITIAAGTDAEAVRDTVAATLVAGSNITITPDDTANTITIASSGGSGGYSTVQDEGTARTQRAVLNFAGSGVSVTDDTANSRTLVTIPGSGTTTPGMPFVVVAGADSPQSVKDVANYVCDGTADQTEINAALLDAFLTAGGGRGTVLLSGKFTINGSILMRHATVLAGSGHNTIIQSASGMTAVGMIMLFDVNTALTQVRDLTLWGNFASGGSSHGIAYRGSTGTLGSAAGSDGNLSTHSPGNNPDPSHRIDNIYVKAFTTGTRHGIWLDDNCRDTNIQRARIFDCSGSGLRLTGASDGKFQQVITSACNIGFEVGGASNQFTQCKSAYAVTDGWQITSSRAHLTGCHGQDSGRWGYNVTGSTPTLSSCVSDSNQRLDTTGGGMLLNAEGVYEACDVYDRNQTPASRQTRGIQFGTSITGSYVTGHVGIPTGTNWVVGTTPGANSFVRICRGGQVGSTSVYAIG